MPAGRPTDYRPEYCQQVIDFMGQGYSLTAFAGSIGTWRSRCYEWAEKHPEFQAAIKAAQGARTARLEAELLSEELGPRVTARIFALKNAAPDEWRDRQQHEHTGEGGGPVIFQTIYETDKREKGA